MSEGHDDYGGLTRDLPRLPDRRQVLLWAGGISLAGLLAACGGTDSAGGSSTQVDTSTQVGTTTEGAGEDISPGDPIPGETACPYPADGSNGPNLLTDNAVMRPGHPLQH